MEEMKRVEVKLEDWDVPGGPTMRGSDQLGLGPDPAGPRGNSNRNARVHDHDQAQAQAQGQSDATRTPQIPRSKEEKAYHPRVLAARTQLFAYVDVALLLMRTPVTKLYEALERFKTRNPNMLTVDTFALSFEEGIALFPQLDSNNPEADNCFRIFAKGYLIANKLARGVAPAHRFDFMELFAAMALLCEGNVRVKAKFIFDLFDLDKSNELGQDELGLIISQCSGALSRLHLMAPLDEAEIAYMCTMAYTLPDGGSTDSLSFDDFYQWITRFPQTLKLLDTLTLIPRFLLVLQGANKRLDHTKQLLQRAIPGRANLSSVRDSSFRGEDASEASQASAEKGTRCVITELTRRRVTLCGSFGDRKQVTLCLRRRSIWTDQSEHMPLHMQFFSLRGAPGFTFDMRRERAIASDRHFNIPLTPTDNGIVVFHINNLDPAAQYELYVPVVASVSGLRDAQSWPSHGPEEDHHELTNKYEVLRFAAADAPTANGTAVPAPVPVPPASAPGVTSFSSKKHHRDDSSANNNRHTADGIALNFFACPQALSQFAPTRMLFAPGVLGRPNMVVLLSPPIAPPLVLTRRLHLVTQSLHAEESESLPDAVVADVEALLRHHLEDIARWDTIPRLRQLLQLLPPRTKTGAGDIYQSSIPRDGSNSMTAARDDNDYTLGLEAAPNRDEHIVPRTSIALPPSLAEMVSLVQELWPPYTSATARRSTARLLRTVVQDCMDPFTVASPVTTQHGVATVYASVLACPLLGHQIPRPQLVAALRRLLLSSNAHSSSRVEGTDAHNTTNGDTGTTTTAAAVTDAGADAEEEMHTVVLVLDWPLLTRHRCEPLCLWDDASSSNIERAHRVDANPGTSIPCPGASGRWTSRRTAASPGTPTVESQTCRPAVIGDENAEHVVVSMHPYRHSNNRGEEGVGAIPGEHCCVQDGNTDETHTEGAAEEKTGQQPLCGWPDDDVGAVLDLLFAWAEPHVASFPTSTTDRSSSSTGSDRSARASTPPTPQRQQQRGRRRRVLIVAPPIDANDGVVTAVRALRHDPPPVTATNSSGPKETNDTAADGGFGSTNGGSVGPVALQQIHLHRCQDMGRAAAAPSTASEHPIHGIARTRSPSDHSAPTRWNVSERYTCIHQRASASENDLLRSGWRAVRPDEDVTTEGKAPPSAQGSSVSAEEILGEDEAGTRGGSKCVKRLVVGVSVSCRDQVSDAATISIAMRAPEKAMPASDRARNAGNNKDQQVFRLEDPSPSLLLWKESTDRPTELKDSSGIQGLEAGEQSVKEDEATTEKENDAVAADTRLHLDVCWDDADPCPFITLGPVVGVVTSTTATLMLELNQSATVELLLWSPAMARSHLADVHCEYNDQVDNGPWELDPPVLTKTSILGSSALAGEDTNGEPQHLKETDDGRVPAWYGKLRRGVDYGPAIVRVRKWVTGGEPASFTVTGLAPRMLYKAVVVGARMQVSSDPVLVDDFPDASFRTLSAHGHTQSFMVYNRQNVTLENSVDDLSATLLLHKDMHVHRPTCEMVIHAHAPEDMTVAYDEARGAFLRAQEQHTQNTAQGNQQHRQAQQHSQASAAHTASQARPDHWWHLPTGYAKETVDAAAEGFRRIFRQQFGTLYLRHLLRHVPSLIGTSMAQLVGASVFRRSKQSEFSMDALRVAYSVAREYRDSLFAQPDCTAGNSRAMDIATGSDHGTDADTDPSSKKNPSVPSPMNEAGAIMSQQPRSLRGSFLQIHVLENSAVIMLDAAVSSRLRQVEQVAVAAAAEQEANAARRGKTLRRTCSSALPFAATLPPSMLSQSDWCVLQEFLDQANDALQPHGNDVEALIVVSDSPLVWLPPQQAFLAARRAPALREYLQHTFSVHHREATRLLELLFEWRCRKPRRSFCIVSAGQVTEPIYTDIRQLASGNDALQVVVPATTMPVDVLRFRLNVWMRLNDDVEFIHRTPYAPPELVEFAPMSLSVSTSHHSLVLANELPLSVPGQGATGEEEADEKGGDAAENDAPAGTDGVESKAEDDNAQNRSVSGVIPEVPDAATIAASVGGHSAAVGSQSSVVHGVGSDIGSGHGIVADGAASSVGSVSIQAGRNAPWSDFPGRTLESLVFHGSASVVGVPQVLEDDASVSLGQARGVDGADATVDASTLTPDLGPGAIAARGVQSRGPGMVRQNGFVRLSMLYHDTGASIEPTMVTTPLEIVQLLVGPVVGRVAWNAARILVEVSHEIEVRVGIRCATNGIVKEVNRVLRPQTPEHFDFQHLNPDSRYHVWVWPFTELVEGDTATASFRTLPFYPSRLRLAFTYDNNFQSSVHDNDLEDTFWQNYTQTGRLHDMWALRKAADRVDVVETPDELAHRESTEGVGYRKNAWTSLLHDHRPPNRSWDMVIGLGGNSIESRLAFDTHDVSIVAQLMRNAIGGDDADDDDDDDEDDEDDEDEYEDEDADDDDDDVSGGWDDEEEAGEGEQHEEKQNDPGNDDKGDHGKAEGGAQQKGQHTGVQGVPEHELEVQNVFNPRGRELYVILPSKGRFFWDDILSSVLSVDDEELAEMHVTQKLRDVYRASCMAPFFSHLLRRGSTLMLRSMADGLELREVLCKAMLQRRNPIPKAPEDDFTGEKWAAILKAIPRKSYVIEGLRAIADKVYGEYFGKLAGNLLDENVFAVWPDDPVLAVRPDARPVVRARKRMPGTKAAPSAPTNPADEFPPSCLLSDDAKPAYETTLLPHEKAALERERAAREGGDEDEDDDSDDNDEDDGEESDDEPIDLEEQRMDLEDRLRRLQKKQKGKFMVLGPVVVVSLDLTADTPADDATVAKALKLKEKDDKRASKNKPRKSRVGRMVGQFIGNTQWRLLNEATRVRGAKVIVVCADHPIVYRPGATSLGGKENPDMSMGAGAATTASNSTGIGRSADTVNRSVWDLQECQADMVHMFEGLFDWIRHGDTAYTMDDKAFAEQEEQLRRKHQVGFGRGASERKVFFVCGGTTFPLCTRIVNGVVPGVLESMESLQTEEQSGRMGVHHMPGRVAQHARNITETGEVADVPAYITQICVGSVTGPAVPAAAMNLPTHGVIGGHYAFDHFMLTATRPLVHEWADAVPQGLSHGSVADLVLGPLLPQFAATFPPPGTPVATEVDEAAANERAPSVWIPSNTFGVLDVVAEPDFVEATVELRCRNMDVGGAVSSQRLRLWHHKTPPPNSPTDAETMEEAQKTNSVQRAMATEVGESSPVLANETASGAEGVSSMVDENRHTSTDEQFRQRDGQPSDQAVPSADHGQGVGAGVEYVVDEADSGTDTAEEAPAVDGGLQEAHGDKGCPERQEPHPQRERQTQQVRQEQPVQQQQQQEGRDKLEAQSSEGELVQSSGVKDDSGAQNSKLPQEVEEPQGERKADQSGDGGPEKEETKNAVEHPQVKASTDADVVDPRRLELSDEASDSNPVGPETGAEREQQNQEQEQEQAQEGPNQSSLGVEESGYEGRETGETESALDDSKDEAADRRNEPDPTSGKDTDVKKDPFSSLTENNTLADVREPLEQKEDEDVDDGWSQSLLQLLTGTTSGMPRLLVGPIIGQVAVHPHSKFEVPEVSARVLLELDRPGTVTCTFVDVLSHRRHIVEQEFPARRPYTLVMTGLAPDRRYRVEIDGVDLCDPVDPIFAHLAKIGQDDHGLMRGAGAAVASGSTGEATGAEHAQSVTHAAERTGWEWLQDSEMGRFSSNTYDATQFALPPMGDYGRNVGEANGYEGARCIGLLHTPVERRQRDINVVVVSGDDPKYQSRGSKTNLWQELGRRLEEPFHGLDVVLHIGGQINPAATYYECVDYLQCVIEAEQNDTLSPAERVQAEQLIVERLRQEYRQAFTRPGVRRVLRNCSNLMFPSTTDIAIGSFWENPVVQSAAGRLVRQFSELVAVEYQRQLWDPEASVFVAQTSGNFSKLHRIASARAMEEAHNERTPIEFPGTGWTASHAGIRIADVVAARNPGTAIGSDQEQKLQQEDKSRASGTHSQSSGGRSGRKKKRRGWFGFLRREESSHDSSSNASNGGSDHQSGSHSSHQSVTLGPDGLPYDARPTAEDQKLAVQLGGQQDGCFRLSVAAPAVCVLRLNTRDWEANPDVKEVSCDGELPPLQPEDHPMIGDTQWARIREVLEDTSVLFLVILTEEPLFWTSTARWQLLVEEAAAAEQGLSMPALSQSATGSAAAGADRESVGTMNSSVSTLGSDATDATARPTDMSWQHVRDHWARTPKQQKHLVACLQAWKNRVLGRDLVILCPSGGRHGAVLPDVSTSCVTQVWDTHPAKMERLYQVVCGPVTDQPGPLRYDLNGVVGQYKFFHQPRVVQELRDDLCTPARGYLLMQIGFLVDKETLQELNGEERKRRQELRDMAMQGVFTPEDKAAADAELKARIDETDKKRRAEAEKKKAGHKSLVGGLLGRLSGVAAAREEVVEKEQAQVAPQFSTRRAPYFMEQIERERMARDEEKPLVSFFEVKFVTERNIATTHPPNMFRRWPRGWERFIPGDPVIYFEDDVYFRVATTPETAAFSDHIELDESLVAHIQRAFHMYHWNDFQRPAELRELDWSAPFVRRAQLRKLFVYLWRNMAEDMRCTVSCFIDFFVIDFCCRKGLELLVEGMDEFAFVRFVQNTMLQFAALRVATLMSEEQTKRDFQAALDLKNAIADAKQRRIQHKRLMHTLREAFINDKGKNKYTDIIRKAIDDGFVSLNLLRAEGITIPRVLLEEEEAERDARRRARRRERALARKAARLKEQEENEGKRERPPVAEGSGEAADHEGAREGAGDSAETAAGKGGEEGASAKDEGAAKDEESEEEESEGSEEEPPIDIKAMFLPYDSDVEVEYADPEELYADGDQEALQIPLASPSGKSAKKKKGSVQEKTQEEKDIQEFGKLERSKPNEYIRRLEERAAKSTLRNLTLAEEKKKDRARIKRQWATVRRNERWRALALRTAALTDPCPAFVPPPSAMESNATGEQRAREEGEDEDVDDDQDGSEEDT